MSDYRTTIREKLHALYGTIVGTGTTQNLDFVVPDGMMMVVRGVQVRHDKTSNALIGAQVIDPDGNVTQSFWVASVAAGIYMIAPDRVADATQHGYQFRPHGEPLLIPSGHALRVCCGNVDNEHYTYYYLNYGLKPYSFNRDNSPPI